MQNGDREKRHHKSFETCKTGMRRLYPNICKEYSLAVERGDGPRKSPNDSSFHAISVRERLSCQTTHDVRDDTYDRRSD